MIPSILSSEYWDPKMANKAHTGFALIANEARVAYAGLGGARTAGIGTIARAGSKVFLDDPGGCDLGQPKGYWLNLQPLVAKWGRSLGMGENKWAWLPAECCAGNPPSSPTAAGGVRSYEKPWQE